MSWWNRFFTKDASPEFISAISLKKGTIFKLLKSSCEISFCTTFSDKVAGFQSIGCDFIKNNVFDTII